MTWDPRLYLTFADARSRPAADLLARVPLDAATRAMDLGCGPGNSTALIAARYPHARLAGIDSSSAMIEAARSALPHASFAVGDFEAYSPTPDTDLIVANAAFQWSPDPVGLSARLLAALRPGGWLAIQVPQNYDQPSHRVIAETVASGPWAAALAGVATYDPGGFARDADYVRALRHFADTIDVWTTTYVHILDGPDPVFTWMSATGLRPFLDALEGPMRSAFEDAIRIAYASAYPPEPDGRTLFAFRRLFVVCARTA